MGTDAPKQKAAPVFQASTFGGRSKFVNTKKPNEAPKANRFADLPLNENDQDSSAEKSVVQ